MLMNADQVMRNRKTFTTEGTEEHGGDRVIGKAKALPLINTDNTDPEKETTAEGVTDLVNG